ncbi:hypothetical protein AB0B94_30210 [Micromonospora sp. NPDC048986]|uniref:hypothetical protein n=1 Tax=Micromonospora sp. NPDC048986 TaxID=3155644 RepID=UPI00340E7893
MSIEITAVFLTRERQVFHTYATWNGWAFDHSGWSPEPQLLAVNTDFEGQPLKRLKIAGSLAEFCEEHRHRMPNQYWRDPRPRARAYVGRYTPPWV